MKRKYTTLRIIASALKIAGILVLGLTILSVVGIFGTGIMGGIALDQLGGQFDQGTGGLGTLTGLILALMATTVPIVLGGSSAMILFAIGDVINLQIDIEENTRTTVLFLQQQTMTLAPSLPVQQSQHVIREPEILSNEAEAQKNIFPNAEQQ